MKVRLFSAASVPDLLLHFPSFPLSPTEISGKDKKPETIKFKIATRGGEKKQRGNN